MATVKALPLVVLERKVTRRLAAMEKTLARVAELMTGASAELHAVLPGVRAVVRDANTRAGDRKAIEHLRDDLRGFGRELGTLLGTLEARLKALEERSRP